MTDNQLNRYLKLLNIIKREPSFDFLKEIVRKHLIKIPFENISKIYRYKKYKLTDIPDLDDFLEGIEKNNFGGTCYTNNYFINQLLGALGFKVDLCGADLKSADAHLVNIVKYGSDEYIVDVGYAAPFYEPLQRNIRENYTIISGEDRYVLHPADEEGRSELEHFRKGKLRNSYLINPRSRNIDEFKNVISDSFNSDSTFMNVILAVKFDDGFYRLIHNKQLIYVFEQEVSVKNAKNADELAEFVELVTGIPKDISQSIFMNFPFEGNAW